LRTARNRLIQHMLLEWMNKPDSLPIACLILRFCIRQTSVIFLNILYNRYEINLNEVQISISGSFFSFLVCTSFGMYIRSHFDDGTEIKLRTTPIFKLMCAGTNKVINCHEHTRLKVWTFCYVWEWRGFLETSFGRSQTGTPSTGFSRGH
jgi:hypothetical protein